MADYEVLLADLAAESADLDRTAAKAADWTVATPAEGWTIAHQIAHLHWTDDKALVSITDPDAWPAQLEAAMADPLRFVDHAADEGAARDRDELLSTWRDGRDRLHAALADVQEGKRFPWYGPPLSRAGMVLARMMETWAHGQDVADALGEDRPFTQRLKHIAGFGHRTYRWSFTVNGKPEPSTDLRLELSTPDGELWTWGLPIAPDVVRGPALDLCLLVTQRRHRDDLALVAEGDNAETWLGIAQAFAGPPGNGRTKGQFG